MTLAPPLTCGHPEHTVTLAPPLTCGHPEHTVTLAPPLTYGHPEHTVTLAPSLTCGHPEHTVTLAPSLTCGHPEHTVTLAPSLTWAVMKYSPAWASMHAATNAHSAQSPASQPQQSPEARASPPPPPPSSDDGILVAAAHAQGRWDDAQAHDSCFVDSTEPPEQQLSSCRALQVAAKVRRHGGAWGAWAA